ncbi:MAG: hypothetical protein KBE38_05420 [Ignavibacterium sp.]|nr:hypothetical protein [Ignavibacterium sp.]
MKTKYLLSLLLLILILGTQYSQATIRYVSKTGTSTPPYTSWQTAADSIQKCINFCVDGDTIYVANGVYYEAIYVDRTINLIGSSMDSTVIDGTNISGYDIVYFFENNSSFKNFKITSSNPQRTGINTWESNIKAESCHIYNITICLLINSSSVSISNFIIQFYQYGILDECPFDTCHSVYSNNIIFSTNADETPVEFGFGGNPTFTNNIVIEEGTSVWYGVDTYTSGLTFTNNLISGFRHTGLDLSSMPGGSQQATNNVITNIIDNGFDGGAIMTGTGSQSTIQNNIITNSTIGIHKYNSTNVRSDYNLFWQVQQLMSGQPFIGDSNIVADPMMINDTVPRISGTYDYHLQAYSPAIDKGNPSVQDVDGTRSDIGLYGGPFGETYTYQDLAPLAPRNLSAVVDTNQILLKWNRNTEADTSYYKVYRDTVISFQIDSTKLVSSLADTFIVQQPPYSSSKYVYKITCVDNQGNESNPSQELVVNITSVSTNDYPMTISDYVLYQNYPNPFNPSTKIGYQLKERAYVKLMVYDIKGELIGVLVNKEQTAGYYEVEFNVGNGLPSVPNVQGLASGIYLYRIEVIGEGSIPVYIEMKKMLLLK